MSSEATIAANAADIASLPSMVLHTGDINITNILLYVLRSQPWHTAAINCSRAQHIPSLCEVKETKNHKIISQESHPKISNQPCSKDPALAATDLRHHLH
mmetsp:Transcript_34104/g.74763  ORF Transcript_34104/g.74763 Transcript_34104/m.74763 type:complete len:100 (+) Transcript_34104:68-367(+)